MDRCLFQDSEHCNCVGGSENLKVISDTRLNTIILKSKKRSDVLHTEFRSLPASTVLRSHEACISRYTSQFHIDKYLKRKAKEKLESTPPLPKKTRRASSANSSFIWKSQCLFCGDACEVKKDSKHPDRWRRAFVCRTSDRGPNNKSFKDYLLKVRI